MAGELQASFGAVDTNGNLIDSIPFTNYAIDQALKLIWTKVIPVTTAEADLDTSAAGITTYGYLYLRNLDPTNYVSFGPKNATPAMQAFAKLKKNEFAFFRLDPATVLRWIANTATCNVLVKLYND